MREIWLKRGSSISLVCKLAASSTINDLYVVSCKTGQSFDQVLHGYPWVTAMFSTKQPHPMIGRGVCPLFKRTIVFPKDDRMDFEYEIIPVKTGTMLLVQQHKSKLRNLWEDFPPSYMMVAGLLLFLAWIGRGEYHSCLVPAMPYVLGFYTIRTVADRSMGIEWLPRYQLLP